MMIQNVISVAEILLGAIKGKFAVKFLRQDGRERNRFMSQETTPAPTRAKQLDNAATALKKTVKDLQTLEHLASDPERGAFKIAEISLRLLKTLEPAVAAGPVVLAAQQWVIALAESARAAQQKARAAIPAELARLLEPMGLTVTGTLPDLRCGILTLRFRLETRKPDVEIQYGPGIASLKKMPVAADKIAAEVVNIVQTLDGTPLDATQFLHELRTAYRIACARHGETDDGRPVPLTRVMAELAFSRQSAAFLADPVRDRFTPYSRVQFSYDLFRLRERTLDGEELRLTIATREQTRQAGGHLWIPTSAAGQGTHYASLSFRRIS